MDTMMTYTTRRKRRKTGRWLLLFIIVVALVIAAVVYFKEENQVKPNMSYVTPAYMQQSNAIMLRGEWTGYYAAGQGEGLKIPLPVAQLLAEDGVRYEADTESIILTTGTKVLYFKTGALDATMNSEPIELRFASEKVDGELYLPIAPFVELFGVRVDQAEETGIVTLLEPGQAIQRVELPAAEEEAKETVEPVTIKLRAGPSLQEPIIEDLAPETGLRLWGESDGWYMLQSPSGHLGYLSKMDASLTDIERIAPVADDPEPFVSWKVVGEKINLTWEAVYSFNPNPANIGPLQGVNVVSPTWFELQNEKGDIVSNASAEYVAWARENGRQVWALFSNGFEPKQTTEALATYETRQYMIRQLLAYAKTYKLQGINIDFENVYTKDKENLVQFVREMTPLMHEQNLVVSIDVTPKSNSEMWSVFLDRPKLAEVVDYMMVMAYDEHWASSPVAGSVSSLSWAEGSIRKILEEDRVPASKLILGIPLYTRVWTEQPDDKGGVKVSSKAIGMDAANKIVKDKGLTPVLSESTNQYYVEYKEDGALKKIWLENAHSIKARAELAKKYNLAGVATWRRGFESADIWPVLDETLQSRP